MPDSENGNDLHSQTATRKPTTKTITRLARRVAHTVVRAGLSYEDWRRLNKMVRRYARLRPAKRRQSLPKILTDDELARFWAAVDRGGNPAHALMIRVLYFTGARVSELTAMTASAVDLGRCSIRISHGKGDKDRVVLFPESLRLPLSLHLEQLDGDRLWVGRQGPLTARRVRQIVDGYASAAGVQASPHTFRHQALTHLTRAGLSDAEIQLVSGHSRRETLAIYQHLALPDVAEKYQRAFK